MVLLTNNFCWTVWNFHTICKAFYHWKTPFLKISYDNFPFFLRNLSQKDPFFYVSLIYHWRHLYVTEAPPPSLGHSIHWNELIFHFKLIKFNFKQFINFMQFLILTTNVKHWARVPNSATLYTNFQRACTGGYPFLQVFLIVIFLFREVFSIFWGCPHIHTTKFANYHTPLIVPLWQ